MRKFILHRIVDVTGVSGTGAIAEGVEWSDRSVVVRWFGATPSTIVYKSAADMEQVHGHKGRTKVIWEG